MSAFLACCSCLAHWADRPGPAHSEQEEGDATSAGPTTTSRTPTTSLCPPPVPSSAHGPSSRQAHAHLPYANSPYPRLPSIDTMAPDLMSKPPSSVSDDSNTPGSDCTPGHVAGQLVLKSSSSSLPTLAAGTAMAASYTHHPATTASMNHSAETTLVTRTRIETVIRDKEVLHGVHAHDAWFGHDARSDMLRDLDMTVRGCLADMREALPKYLDVYWERVHRDFPIIHVPSFEAHEDHVLRCAMAALATQFLCSCQDRAHGNALHEFASLEIKRVSRKQEFGK